MFICRQTAESATEYLEGVLPWRESLRVRFHLGGCKDCRAYVSQLRATVQALAGLARESAPPVVRGELLARFRDATVRPQKRRAKVMLLAALERGLGRGRGYLAVAVTLVVALLWPITLGVGGVPGAGSRCFTAELLAGLGPLFGVSVLMLKTGGRLSAATLVGASGAGAAGAFLYLHFECGLAQVMSHALLFHTGGMAAVAILAAAAAHLPAFRS